MTWERASEIVLAAVLVAAAVTELRRGKIYNWLTYPAIIVGLGIGAAAGAAEGAAWDAFRDHLFGFGAGFGVLFAAYIIGGMGGGDVKLMGAVGAFLGWPGALHATLYSFLVAAAMGLILMIWRGQTRSVLRRLGVAIRLLPLPGVKMDEAVPASSLEVPFGLAACIGTLWHVAEYELGGSLVDLVGSLF